MKNMAIAQTLAEIQEKFNIPNRRNGVGEKYITEWTQKLMLLKIGDKMLYPRERWKLLYQDAKTAKIKITSRAMGNKDEITVWRIE